MKFGLIIPVYNAQQTLDKTIQSIINQTSAFDEVWFVDNGSTDNSKSIIAKYTHKYQYLNYIYTEICGVSHARNLGIQKIQTEYICFLDADDYLEDYMLHELKNMIALSNNQLEKQHIIQFNFNQEFANGLTKMNPYILSQGSYSSIEFMQQNIKRFEEETKNMVWSFCFPKQLFLQQNVMFNEQLTMFEDIEFLYQLLCCNSEKIKIHVFNQVLMMYTYNVSSVTQNAGKTYFIHLKHLLDNYREKYSWYTNFLKELSVKTLSLQEYKKLSRMFFNQGGTLYFIGTKVRQSIHRIIRKIKG